MAESGYAKYFRFKRLSTVLLLMALATTVLACAVGQRLMVNLYRTSLVTPKNGAIETWRTNPPLFVSIARTPGGPREWVNYAAVLSKLERDIDRPIVVSYSLDRYATPSLMASKRVDIAFVPIISYLRLKQSGDATLVAAPIIASQTRDAALLVVSHNSGLTTLDQLRGKHLLLTPGSLVGHAFAYWLLARNETTPEAFFGSVVTSGTHDAHLGMVDRGEADATCVNRSDLASWPKGTFRVIAESPEFGLPPMIARADLGAETVRAIQSSLLSVGRGSTVASDSAISGFSIPNDSDYDFARELASHERGAESLSAVASR